jgi:hypothetical protein
VTTVSKIPRSILMSKASKRDDNVGIILYETSIEIGKPEE